MRILHLCTYDVGGAGNAALRLHRSLLEMGHDSIFCSKLSTHSGENKIVADGGASWLHKNSPRIEYYLARILHPSVRPVLTTDLLPGCGLSVIKKIKPDVVNLHWINHGLLGSRDLQSLSQLGIPMVWTLHDLAPISGGIGYREAFDLSPEAFGPLVIPGKRSKQSELLIRKRTTSLKQAHIKAVSPSRWLAEEAARSPVFSNHKVLTIPNGIDTRAFHSIPSSEARERWNIPVDRKVILFAADTFMERRKGLQHLIKALELLPRNGSVNPILLAFGNHEPLNPEEWPVDVLGLGRLSDPAELAAVYSAADVFACPSREDNLPNTVIESLACGVPVVGFAIGGVPDFVIPEKTGYLASPYDEKELVQCLMKVLNADASHALMMRQESRKIAENHLSLRKQATSYQEIYQSLIDAPQP